MGNQEIKGSLGQGQGYRVISISESSPCYNAGIQFFTDFIIDVEPAQQNNETLDATGLELNKDGQYVVDEKKDFFTIVGENEDKPLNMIIYDTLQRKFRKVQIIPNKQWSQQGNLLGVMLRLENYLTSHDNTFKVIKVDENSPAQKAGIIPKSDYIIGLKKYKYEGLDELINIIVVNEGQEIELIVFNIQEKKVRTVCLKPQMNWGGRGLIGCEFAGGFLNQLPVILDEATEQANREQEQKKLESLNTQLHKVEQKPKPVLFQGPPPTNIQVQNENNNQNINQSYVAHTHHQIIQQIKTDKKHHHTSNEVAHNTDPFAIQRKNSQTQHDDHQKAIVSPIEQTKRDRLKSSDYFKQSSHTQIAEEQEKVRKSSKSLTTQVNTTHAYNISSQSAEPTQQDVSSNDKQYTNETDQLTKIRRNSVIGNRRVSESEKKYEYECPNLPQPQKYFIHESDLFNLKAKLQSNSLLFEHEYKLGQ